MSTSTSGRTTPSLALASAAENDGKVAVGSLGDGEATSDLEIFIPSFPRPRENPKLDLFPGLNKFLEPSHMLSFAAALAADDDVVNPGRAFLGRPGDHNTPSLVANINCSWALLDPGRPDPTTSISVSGQSDDDDEGHPSSSSIEAGYLCDVITGLSNPCRSLDSVPINDIDCQNA